MAQTQQASDALLPGSHSNTGDSSLPMSRERSWWEWLARGLACLVLTLGAVPGARNPNSQHLESVPGFQWVVLACLVAIALPWLPPRGWSRGVASLLLLASSLRYAHWRFATVNTNTPLVQACSLLMVVVEVLYLGNLMVPLFLIQSSAYRSRSRQVDKILASGVTDSPSVDIVVQATKQPMRLIRRALLSSLDLGCKPRSITVVDENCREEIRDLAQGLGARYVVQSLPLSAADLHSSLSGSGAELIAAFDASCMPLKSLLTRTTALFRDKRVAMVQTPQALFHSEDYNRNLGAEVVMPPNRSYSSFFLQVLRDQRNAVLGSGGSAVVRRSALLELDLPLPLGTHQARQASLGLLSGGWRIAYLPEMLSICEAPRCFADYLDRKLQTIHADLLLIPTALSKATWGNLGTWQKGLILNHLTDQFSPLFRVAYLVMPLVALTAGFSLVNASLLDFIGYGGPFLVLLAAVPSWLTQQQRVQFWNGVQDALLAVPSLRGCWNLVLRPSQAFRPLMQDDQAPKNSSRWEGRSPKPQSVHLPLVWPFVVLIVQLCSTLTVRYLMPLLPIPLMLSLPSYNGEDLMLAWNLFNGVMITVCLLCSIDQPVLRNGARVPMQQVVTTEFGSFRGQGNLLDISETGAGIRLGRGEDLPLRGEKGWLILQDGALRLPVQVARSWRGRMDTDTCVGLTFLPLDPLVTTKLLRLLYGNGPVSPATPTVGFLGSILSLLRGLQQAQPEVR